MLKLLTVCALLAVAAAAPAAPAATPTAKEAGKAATPTVAAAKVAAPGAAPGAAKPADPAKSALAAGAHEVKKAEEYAKKGTATVKAVTGKVITEVEKVAVAEVKLLEKAVEVVVDPMEAAFNDILGIFGK